MGLGERCARNGISQDTRSVICLPGSSQSRRSAEGSTPVSSGKSPVIDPQQAGAGQKRRQNAQIYHPIADVGFSSVRQISM
jgi:hypothetical protein